jgi:AraC-like DNA-binding protein
MGAHVREQLTLEQLARAAGTMSRDRLLQLFRPTGESPCRVFKRFKMEEAARLLIADPEVSVKEVALEHGIPSEIAGPVLQRLQFVSRGLGQPVPRDAGGAKRPRGCREFRKFRSLYPEFRFSAISFDFNQQFAFSFAPDLP